jgi:CheY-like chemotaxis protein
LKTVLVVDDDDDMRFILRLLLERSGYQVLDAANGVAALVTIKATRPDVLVTDLRMPMMDGAELTQRVRSDPNLNEIPIVIITAYAVVPETVELADAVIPKPFAPERVADTVARLIGGRRATDREPENSHRPPDLPSSDG